MAVRHLTAISVCQSISERKMEEFVGSRASEGLAMGRIAVFWYEGRHPEKIIKEDVCKELIRLDEAVISARAELRALYTKAVKKVGEEQALIFDVHGMMMEDADYRGTIEKFIKEDKVCAEYAVFAAGEIFKEKLECTDKAYHTAKTADIEDISKRIIRNLTGDISDFENTDEGAVVIAKDLMPGEAIRLHESKVSAFITEKGSVNSHTAILARSLKIPYLVNVKAGDLFKLVGKTAVVDAVNGKLYLGADTYMAEVMDKIKQKLEKTDKTSYMLNTVKEKSSYNRIKVFANIGSEKEIDKAIENEAEGIGLFRSEFLFIGKNKILTEEEQFSIYKEAISKMYPKKVMIRVIDFGGDKKPDYLKFEEEINPALGIRGIRFCFARKDLLKTQIRALLRASAYGNAAVVFPMINSVEEVRKIKAIIEKIKQELVLEKVRVGNPETGIMIETPAAALISDELAKEVEFLSIGTNDLIQYTLAADRNNEKLLEFYNPYHRAVSELIKLVCKNAHKNNINVGICGELAGDTELTAALCDMGIDMFSVEPSKIQVIKKVVRSL